MASILTYDRLADSAKAVKLPCANGKAAAAALAAQGICISTQRLFLSSVTMSMQYWPNDHIIVGGSYVVRSTTSGANVAFLAYGDMAAWQYCDAFVFT